MESHADLIDEIQALAAGYEEHGLAPYEVERFDDLLYKAERMNDYGEMSDEEYEQIADIDRPKLWLDD